MDETNIKAFEELYKCSFLGCMQSNDEYVFQKENGEFCFVFKGNLFTTTIIWHKKIGHV